MNICLNNQNVDINDLTNKYDIDVLNFLKLCYKELIAMNINDNKIIVVSYKSFNEYSMKIDKDTNIKECIEDVKQALDIMQQKEKRYNNLLGV